MLTLGIGKKRNHERLFALKHFVLLWYFKYTVTSDECFDQENAREFFNFFYFKASLSILTD